MKDNTGSAFSKSIAPESDKLHDNLMKTQHAREGILFLAIIALVFVAACVL